MSKSLQPHGLEPACLLCLWDFPSNNTEVGCHFLLQGTFPTQGLNFVSCISRWILYHWAIWEVHMGGWGYLKNASVSLKTWCLTGCSPPGSSVHGIFQARNWGGFPLPSPGCLSDPGIEPGSPAWQADCLSLSYQGSPWVWVGPQIVCVCVCVCVCMSMCGIWLQGNTYCLKVSCPARFPLPWFFN